MNAQYWEDRYKKQGLKTVGCCSLSEKEFEDKTINAAEKLFRCMMKNKIYGEKLLDLGCGWGRMTDSYIAFCQQIFGIDVVPWAIEQAKERYPTGNFHVFDGEKIPFSDGYFNTILAWTVLQHILPESIEGICKEIIRVMDPKARLIIYENISIWYSDKPHVWFRSPLQYKKLFKGMRSVDECVVENADGSNNEHHVLMVLKKDSAFVPEFQDNMGDG
ncbi:MAG: class I SAM-dependent methyltransferase [Desulfobacterales bacterium]|nr:class I SAM-dependent methyltransferase [Desulfobacterales bacterium]